MPSYLFFIISANLLVLCCLWFELWFQKINKKLFYFCVCFIHCYKHNSLFFFTFYATLCLYLGSENKNTTITTENYVFLLYFYYYILFGDIMKEAVVEKVLMNCVARKHQMFVLSKRLFYVFIMVIPFIT